MIDRNHPSLSVGAQCRLLSIARSSFYYELMGETAMNLDLMVVIDKQFLETPFYGVQQMTWHLRNDGYAVNYKRIRRLMRLMRLMPIYQKPDTSRPAKGHKTYPYLLGGLPEEMAQWSLTSLQLKLIKIGARVVRHARAITFQLAEVAVTGPMVRAILAAIRRLRAPPSCA